MITFDDLFPTLSPKTRKEWATRKKISLRMTPHPKSQKKNAI